MRKYFGVGKPGAFYEPLNSEEEGMAEALVETGWTWYDANQFLRKVADYTRRYDEEADEE